MSPFFGDSKPDHHQNELWISNIDLQYKEIEPMTILEKRLAVCHFQVNEDNSG